MPRYKLTIEYDGTPYAGWQRQEDGIASVQAALELALDKITQEAPTLYCAGRTDAGVHARGQVAHFDFSRQRNPFNIIEGLNFYLLEAGEPIRVLDCAEVTEEFHARFSAKARHYHYHIINRRVPLALDEGRYWHVPYPLDLSQMREASQHVIGTHDFSSFRALACQSKSAIKTLDRLEFFTEGEHIRVELSAKSFLHHQVRNLVGSLMWVGYGKWSVEDFIAARDARDRRASGPTAPACGLYFMAVEY